MHVESARQTKVLLYGITLVLWIILSSLYILRTELDLPTGIIGIIPYLVLLLGLFASFLGVRVMIPVLEMDLSIWIFVLSIVLFDHAVLSQFEMWNRVKYILATVIVIAGVIYYLLRRGPKQD